MPGSKKNKAKRDVLIKTFIQRTCTPTTSEKRLKTIISFLDGSKSVKFSHDDAMYIWKGLFYAVWYTEMGKGCEEIMAAIAKGCASNRSLTVAGFESVAAEWSGIDYIRVDKFAHLVRHMVRSAIRMEASILSEEDCGTLMMDILSKIKETHGLFYHVSYIIVDEVFFVLYDKIYSKEERYTVLSKVLLNFTDILTTTDDTRTITVVTQNIFQKAMLQIEARDLPYTLVTFLDGTIQNLISKGSASDIKIRNRNAAYSLAECMKQKLIDIKSNLSKKRLADNDDDEEDFSKRTRFVRSVVPVAVN